MCPIYEYKCKYCKETTEHLEKLDAIPVIKCPNCNKNTLERQLASGGFRLHGDGYYKPNKP